MKLTSFTTLVLSAASLVGADPTLVKRANPKGIDVSHYQPNVDFVKVKNNGLSFVYIKATEGTSMSTFSYRSLPVG